MRSAWICVLSLAWSACASSAPVSGDVDETALGLGSDDEHERADDSPPLAAKPIVTCFDASHGISVAVEARRPEGPGRPGQPGVPPLPPGSGSGDECDPDAPPHGGVEPVPPVPSSPAAEAPRPPVIVVVERERGAVACGCGIGFAQGVAGVPADAPVPGVAAIPARPASGGEQHGSAEHGAADAPAGAGTASGGHHVASGTHTVGVPGVPAAPAIHTAANGGPDAPSAPSAPGAPVVTVTVSSGAPGEPAKLVPPPSCDALTEQCYADGLATELCEELADCCANTSAPDAPPAPH